MLYLVLAHDGTDAEAPQRRASVRAQHLEAAQAAAASGTLVMGGALLADDGTMTGSAMVIEADDEAAARAMVENDIYRRSGVWVDVHIWPFRRAV